MGMGMGMGSLLFAWYMNEAVAGDITTSLS
jgi:hypothetical protein